MPEALRLLRTGRSEIDCLEGSPKGRRGGACQPGAFGYHLRRRRRQLEPMGVTNYVVQPQDWDERGKEPKRNRAPGA